MSERARTSGSRGSGRPAPRVVFVMPFPPTTDFARKFFVRELAGAGVRTEYWNVARAMGYGMQHPSDREGLTYREFDSLRDVARAIGDEDASATAFVVQITRGVQSFRVYRTFSRTASPLVFFGRGYLPTPPAERSPSALARKLLHISGVRALVLALVARALRGRLPFTRPYDLVFAAGAAGRRRHLGDALAITDIHHFDVDAATLPPAAPLPARVADRCIVFLDDYLPFHPDFAALGSRTVEPDAYYGALNAFFARVEAEYGMPVVVAAHPRASYTVNPFGGREIVFGATSALVERAALVLAHASTAVSLAVIHRKPLCLVYTDEIARVHPYLYRSMILTAEMLGCPMVDCEHAPDSSLRVRDVDTERYAAYYREYLSIADPATSSAEIVVRELCARLGGEPVAVAAARRAVAGAANDAGWGA